MSVETRRGLELLGAGVLLGVLGDLLLRSTPLGLNVLLWVAAFCGLLLLVTSCHKPLLAWVVAPLLVFSALVVWRDSPWLVSLDVFALVVAVSVGAVRSAATAGLVDYAVGFVDAFLGAVVGTAAVGEQIEWDDLRGENRAEQVAAVGRGALIAAPLVVVFGALFVAADAVFSGVLGGVAPSTRTLVHLGVVTLWFWVGAGLLRTMVAPRATRIVVARPAPLGVTEVVVALAALNALFLAFVLVQIEAFVGGRSFVESHAHVTYSSYARQGFFELVAVAALVLVVVLLADWWVARPARAVRVLQATLVALVFGVMASALWRMRLYEQRYGLTELRFYTTGFMLWLAVVCAWFLATVLRGRRDRFAVGALVSGFAAIAIVHAVNPDGIIARVDAHRAHPDVAYLASLSDDSIPALVHALPDLEPPARRQLARRLRERHHPHDWRSWNVARARAASLGDELGRYAAARCCQRFSNSRAATGLSEPPKPSVPAANTFAPAGVS